MSSDDDLGDESEVEHGHQSDKAPSSDDDSSDESSEESELVVDKASSDNEVEPLSNDDGQVQDDEVDRLADIDAAAVRLYVGTTCKNREETLRTQITKTKSFSRET